MNYNFNVLIMLSALSFFQSNRPMLLKSDQLPGSRTPGTHKPRAGVLFWVRVWWRGWKGTPWASAVEVAGEGRTQFVCDRRSQVKTMCLNDKIRVRGAWNPEEVLFAASYSIAMLRDMKSEELMRAASQPWHWPCWNISAPLLLLAC